MVGAASQLKKMKVLAMVCALAALPALAQDGRSEYSLNLIAIGSKHYAFEGGATARNDGGAGVGLTLARNLNRHFAVGAELTFTQFDYRASVAPGAGNGGAAFDAEGSMEGISLRLQATWNLLSGWWTPFVSAGAGVNFLDPDFRSNPPSNACWIYPWYGQVCSASAPATTLTRLGYSASAGLRFELPHDQGFIRVLAAGEWIEFSEALSTVGYAELRLDFGLRF